MTAQVLDFQAAKDERDARRELRAEALRPYASMDDLPNVTPAGQRAVWALIFPQEKG